MLDLVFVQQLLCFITKMGTIVRDDLMWYSVSTDDVGSNETELPSLNSVS
jgi:hypothetical protein